MVPLFSQIKKIDVIMKHFLKNYWVSGAVAVAVSAAYILLSSSNKTTKEPKGNKKGIRLSGLVNEGNTCFINTTVQALASCRIFLLWMENLLDKKSEILPAGSSCASLQTTMSVLNNRHPTIQENPYSTKQLILSLQRHGWNLLRMEEQDAHEFFNQLLTTIEEETRPPKRNLQTISVTESASGVSNSSSPFRGYLASQLCCLSCGKKAPVHYDVFECLSIPLPKLDINNAFTIFSIEHLLKQFVAPETVNGVHCDNCSTNESKSVFVKQLSLGKIPQCLCLHIQRSEWLKSGHLTKRQDFVQFQEELNVSNLVYTNRLTENWKPVVYHLRAVVEHLGTVHSGHFVTFRQHSMGGRVKWFYTSDTFVRAATIQEVLKSSPYMLFYERSL